MFQVVTKSKFRPETFVLATVATIQEANAIRLQANARRPDANYKVVEAA